METNRNAVAERESGKARPRGSFQTVRSDGYGNGKVEAGRTNVRDEQSRRDSNDSRVIIRPQSRF